MRFKWSPRGRHLAVQAGRTLQIWKLPKGEIVEKVLMPAVYWIDWQQDGGRLALASQDGNIRILDLINSTVSSLTAAAAQHTHSRDLAPSRCVAGRDTRPGSATPLGGRDAALWFSVPEAYAYHFRPGWGATERAKGTECRRAHGLDSDRRRGTALAVRVRPTPCRTSTYRPMAVGSPQSSAQESHLLNWPADRPWTSHR
jgi:hypothetical protein